ncbi:hypothetical protein EMOOHJMP_00233 [Microcystis phage MaAM05]|nr:hypothetical protein EMOOHJMP_00233 [Microcystis phage MaAM05]
MRDEINTSTRFQWPHAYFLDVAEVVFALLDSEEDSLRRRPFPPALAQGGSAWLTLVELEAYHRQLFLWGWRFSRPCKVLLSGPKGTR